MVDQTASSDDRPSSFRRKQLREADANAGTIPTVSNFFPLERYYEASDKVLQSFTTAFEARRLDEAYVYGMRYCTFCVEGITQHDYYRSSGTFEARRTQTNQRVAQVLTNLELVADWMDAQEEERERQRQAILKRQKEEMLRKRQEEEQRRMDELQKRIEQQQKQESKMSATAVEESALAKLQRLSQPLVPLPPPVPVPVPNKRVSFQIDDRPEPDGHYTDSAPQPLPPPLLPPGNGNENAPPSYHQILDQSRLANHSYFGPGAGVQPVTVTTPAAPSYDAVVKKPQKQKPKPPPQPKRLNIRQYIAQAQRMHREYQQQRKIQISALKTYQGSVTGSTNGCTVISACVVSKHLETHGGVTDSQVNSVIDQDCIPLLRSIRSKLGLDGSSLIIPSDVHDHMVDHKLLWQHKFAGAAGGNIVEPSHIGELLNLLQGEKGKTQHLKSAATLFFREHVVSIVKFPTSPTEAVYDMIDSLPQSNNGGRASRTRCMSLDALQVQLEYYTSRKFSDGNCSYIERNRWDDGMADFDPRVFQAFVWADLPKPKE
jgi:flagellar biosynthesis GTPase FlhF